MTPEAGGRLITAVRTTGAADDHGALAELIAAAEGALFRFADMRAPGNVCSTLRRARRYYRS